MRTNDDRRREEMRRAVNHFLGTPAVRRLRARTPAGVTATVAARLAKSQSQRKDSIPQIPISPAVTSTRRPESEGTSQVRSLTTSKAAGQERASKALRDGRTGKASKSAAGLALSQRP